MSNDLWVLGATTLLVATFGTTDPARAALDAAVERRVTALLAQMTLEEKVGQLHQLARPDPLPREEVKAGRIGSLLNVIDPKEVAELQALARQSPPGHPPDPRLRRDPRFRSVFPSPLGEAAAFDPDLAEHDAEIAAQLYVRDPVASRSRPLRELKGFRKMALAPGEQKTVSFAVNVKDLGFHDDAGQYVVEPGEFQVFVGGSSNADLAGTFEVKAAARGCAR